MFTFSERELKVLKKYRGNKYVIVLPTFNLWNLKYTAENCGTSWRPGVSVSLSRPQLKLHSSGRARGYRLGHRQIMNNETLKLIYEITQRYVPARDVMTICPLISYSIDSLSSVLLVLTLRESYRLLFGNHAIRITVLSPPEEYETENIYL